MDLVRTELAVTVTEQTLFLTRLGDPFTADALTDRVRKIVRDSGISKGGACHAFRHTSATVMLEGGADIRFVQAFLGHCKLETTEISADLLADLDAEAGEAAEPSHERPFRRQTAHGVDFAHGAVGQGPREERTPRSG